MNVSKYATFSIEPKRTKNGKKLGRSYKEGENDKKLRDGFDSEGCFAYKIPDPVVMKGERVRGAARPFDTVVWLNNGTVIAYEAKYDDEPKGFGKAQLTDNQRIHLERVYKTGNKSYVVLFVKYKRHVNMLLWPWSYFRTLSKCIGVAEITRLLDEGHGYLARKTGKSLKATFPIGAFLNPPHQHLYGLSQ